VAPPEIVEFRSQPEGSVVIGNAVTLYWDVRGDVLEVTLLANDVPLLSQAPAYGQFVHTPSHLGEVRYTLQAQGPGGAIVQDVVIQVTEVQPTPEPPPHTPEPPTPTHEPPTPTPEPPTPTPVPPIETPVPPTATPEPPTPTPSPAPGQDLRDKNWILENMTKAKMAPQPVLENSQINIFFDPSGSFNGNAGCNDYAGVYVVGEDNALTLTMGQVTNMTCDDPPGVMEQEHQYLQLLANVKSYLIDEGGYLNLYTEDQWTLTYRMGPTPR
jgi:heat shock protein HslJ